MQAPAPDAALTAACPRPERHLRAGDWEVIAGRVGVDLIRCGQEKAALAAYVADLRAAIGAGR